MTQMLIPSNADQSVYPPNDLTQTAALIFAKLAGSPFTGANVFFGGDTIPTPVAGDNSLKVVNSAFVQAVADALVPAGTLLDWPGAAAPAGYATCPLVPTTQLRVGPYSRIFANIGTTWGVGDGSTTFNVPYFPADYVASTANANVGTSTHGQVIAHTHNMPSVVRGVLGNTGLGSTGANAGDFPTDSTGGTDNLAAGIRILKCIKL